MVAPGTSSKPREARGYARISAAVSFGSVGDVFANLEHTRSLWERSHEQHDAVVVFPELGLVGYTLRDLFHDQHLLASAEEAIALLVEYSRAFAPMAVVGAPLRTELGLYNCAVAIQGGKILGVVPKTYLPNYREFEEARWFRSGRDVPAGASIRVAGERVPFGVDIVFEARGYPQLVVGLEICEDYWVPVPPSAYQAAVGATVLCNLSASNFTIGKAQLRRLLSQSMSDRCKCAYLYVAAGPGESSTDLAFDADAFICENGHVVAQSQRFSREDQLVTFDVDLEMLQRERLTFTTFGDCSVAHQRPFRRIAFDAPGAVPLPLRRTVERHPFVPKDPRTLDERCWEVFEIQTNALATRMQAIGRPKLVLGLSGGIDSTHAALVAAGALDLVGQPRADLLCITMPGLGTTPATRTNAVALAETLGATLREIPISEATHLVLRSLDHAAAVDTQDVAALLARIAEQPELGDVALENTQARLRTLLLMTIANADGGIVVGTGDLSEKALGWSTYAGDHISMYDVNAGIPKTLIQFVIRWVARERAASWGHAETLRRILEAIVETPISPELLPADAEGQIAQLTETTLGPYELHDFFLYHYVRHGARPAKILDLARIAFADDYPLPTLKKWIRVFFRRFFTQQFKRSCTADAPKVGPVALSPRGDWRMPSDASVTSWLAEIDAYADD